VAKRGEQVGLLLLPLLLLSSSNTAACSAGQCSAMAAESDPAASVSDMLKYPEDLHLAPLAFQSRACAPMPSHDCLFSWLLCDLALMFCALAVLLRWLQARNDAQQCANVLLSDPQRARFSSFWRQPLQNAANVPEMPVPVSAACMSICNILLAGLHELRLAWLACLHAAALLRDDVAVCGLSKMWSVAGQGHLIVVGGT
jgi:hypothetical protein